MVGLIPADQHCGGNDKAERDERYQRHEHAADEQEQRWRLVAPPFQLPSQRGQRAGGVCAAGEPAAIFVRVQISPTCCISAITCGPLSVAISTSGILSSLNGFRFGLGDTAAFTGYSSAVLSARICCPACPVR